MKKLSKRQILHLIKTSNAFKQTPQSRRLVFLVFKELTLERMTLKEYLELDVLRKDLENDKLYRRLYNMSELIHCRAVFGDKLGINIWLGPPIKEDNMTPIKSLTFYPNGYASAFDQNGENITLKGWMELFFEYLESKGYDPTKINIEAVLNGGVWKSVVPTKTENGWNQLFEPSKHIQSM